jgi:UDP-N-acetylmuramoylalanine--D-glutamate ligase
VAVADPDTELPGRARRVPPADLEGWELGLRGAHNRRNAAFAAAACLARGVPEDAVRTGLRTFAGVEHRLEELGSIGGVLYVNDSKATNDDSTLTALAAFGGRRVHLILGGEAKGGDHAALREAAARCAGVYLIGRDGRELADGVWCETLDRAVEAAAAAAVEGDIVLLSPACASFDQYRDFEERGRHFKELVDRRRNLA